MKFLDNEHLKNLSVKRWEDIPEVLRGFEFSLEDRKDIAISIQRIAKRALGSNEEFKTSKLQYVIDRWVYR